MRKKNNKRKKFKMKKRYIVILIIILFVAFSIFKNKQTNQEDKKIETESIEKRNIAQSISATGTVSTSTTRNVTSILTGYKITSVKVKEGDKINAGDVICTFDTSDISANLASLQKSMNVTQAQSNLGVDSARRNLNDAINNKNNQISTTQQDINNAVKSYEEAVNKLNETRQALINAQTELNNYTPSYNNASDNYNGIKALNDSKQKAYNNAQENYNSGLSILATSEAEYKKYFNGANQLNPATGEIIDPSTYTGYASSEHKKAEENFNTAKSNLLELESNLKNAKKVYEDYKPICDNSLATFSPISNHYLELTKKVSELQGTVSTLEATVNNLKGVYDGAVQAHNNIVSNSDSTIANMQDSLRSSELSASISTESQESQIRAYQKQLEEGNLKALVSGTVTSVNVKKGDIYTGNTIATIEGMEQFIIEAEIDEYDIPDIKEGMKVLIKTDATRDEELEGRVIYTAASSSQNLSGSMLGQNSMNSNISTGNATYKVQIELLTQNDRLRLGMNAKLSIIVDSRENVWTVPYETVHDRENGTKYIEILKNEETGEKEELDVEVGIEGTYYIEIKSEKLTEGMKVVLPEIDTSNSIESLIEAMGADVGV